MKAIVIRGPMDVAIEEQPSPQIERADQVIVRVKAAGICGSDLHTLLGDSPNATYPRIPGHEFVGVVEQIGSGVTRVKAGDRVAVEPILYCGHCYACRQGRQNVCRSVMTSGVHFDGGMREQFLTTEDKLYILPDDLTFHQAVLAEPYTIAVQVNERAGTAAGDLVLIHGAGPIGIVVMDIARSLGAKCIISEVQPARLAMAKEMGADYILNPAEQNLREEVMRISDGMGPNIVIDAAGIPSVLSEAIAMVSPAGAVVNMCFSSKQVPFRIIDVISKETRIVGSRLQNDKFPIVLGRYAQRLKAAEKIITHTFSIENGADAFMLFAENRRETGKIVVTF